MEESRNPTIALTFEQLADLRVKTEVLSQFLQKQLRTYLETLRPLFSPRRLFGKYVGGKEEVDSAEKSFGQLRTQYQQICGNPFSLPQDLEIDALADTDTRVELYPWEYTHVVSSVKETKSLTITAPGRWVLTYNSPYTLSQLRQVMSTQQERRAVSVRQFIVSALVMGLLLEKFSGLAQIFTDLRYQITREKCPGLGTLPLVTLTSCVPSFRPPDDLLLTATRFSGVPAFIELIDIDAVPVLQDPLRLRFEQILQS